ncbi:DUF1513 domain-containing protein [Tepidamorphus sp. 3E244]|uniref:DUF1513 domain-containing protein n=1 Tax=Tepidamorphus sp. 3E244 TaxID=3385498 RepID=UPI0038FD17CC
MAQGPDRRSVILGLAATGALPLTAFADTSSQTHFVACCRKGDGTFAAAVLDEDARLLFTEDLDARGHDSAFSPDGTKAVVFARRPGRFAIVLDLKAQRRVAAFEPPADRHFMGHGFFTRDGALLFASENDFDGERGVMGLYDVANGYRRIGEVETAGIGPHEVLLMRDQRTVAIANGGILTHPDFPRQKLNIPTMTPSLAYLDIASGEIVEQVSLPKDFHQLSIRHIAEDAQGRIWFGGQFEGSPLDGPPLAGFHARGQDIRFCDVDNADWQAFDNYVGSVAASADGERIAMSSPRGGVLYVWDSKTGGIVSRRSIADVCGLAPEHSGFLASDGAGIMHVDTGTARPFDALAWDNHIAALTRQG